MRAPRSATALMTTNNVHVLADGRRVSQLLVADRSQGESAIAVRAIKRLSPHLEVRPVTSLAEAERVLTNGRVATVFVASGLDDRTHGQTIRWFADNAGDTIVIGSGRKRSRRERPTSAASLICWLRSCGAKPHRGSLVMLPSGPWMPAGSFSFVIPHLPADTSKRGQLAAIRPPPRARRRSLGGSGHRQGSRSCR
jgi:hypothetical protein